MKRFLGVLFIIFILMLSSCGGEVVETEHFFDYQKSVTRYKGTWQEGDKIYGVTIQMGEEMEIKFHSPATLSGISVFSDGGELFCKSGEVVIPLSEVQGEEVFRLCRLFSLTEGNIKEISAKDGNTVAIGEAEGVSWSVTTNSKGLPIIIEYRDKRGKSAFTVDKVL